jgi:hypothetical protein
VGPSSPAATGAQRSARGSSAPPRRFRMDRERGHDLSLSGLSAHGTPRTVPFAPLTTNENLLASASTLAAGSNAARADTLRMLSTLAPSSVLATDAWQELVAGFAQCFACEDEGVIHQTLDLVLSLYPTATPVQFCRLLNALVLSLSLPVFVQASDPVVDSVSRAVPR